LANGRLMIASEMQALLEFGWKADWDVQSVLEMGELNDDCIQGQNYFFIFIFLVTVPPGGRHRDRFGIICHSRSEI